MRKNISVGGPSDAHLEGFCRLAACARESLASNETFADAIHGKKLPRVACTAEAMPLTMAFTGLVWGSSAPAEAVVLSTRTLD